MNAPVIVFAYNRPDHLKRTLYALERADGAEQSVLYLFADGSKGEKDREQVQAVRDYIKEYEKQSRFLEVHIECAAKNHGLSEAVITGVSSVLKQYGCAIVVEDDLSVAGDFLHYMNAALEHYKENKRAFMVSGWVPDIPELNGLSTDTFLWYRCNSWGWAIWADRWEKIDWSVKDYRKFRFSPAMRRRMNRGGADLADMLDMYMQGLNHSWAVRLAYTESMQDKLTVFPVRSLVENGGLDGSGTHCHAVQTDDSQKAEIMTAQADKEQMKQCMLGEKVRFGEALPEKRVSKALYRSYSGTRLHCLKWRIKSVLNRLGIYKF